MAIRTMARRALNAWSRFRKGPPSGLAGFLGLQHDYGSSGGTRAKRGRERVLFIALFDPNGIPTIPQQIAQWCRTSRFRFDLLNLAYLPGETGIEIPTGIEFDGYDALLFHSTIAYDVANLSALDRRLRGKIADFPGVKVLMKQDEHYRTYAIADFVGSRKIDVVLTLTRPSEVRRFYPPERTGNAVRFVHYITSFVSEDMTTLRSPPLRERPIDVSYRGSLQPWHFGRLAYEKADIGERFREAARTRGLNVDISSRWEDRHFGAAWIDFMCRSRAVLGVEGGASIVDFTGQVECATKDYLQQFPGASFEEVSSAVLAPHENNCYYRTISPRIFEAAACRCVQVLFEGDYSSVLEAGRHYIPLRRDFADVDDVIRRLRDLERCQSMVDRSFEEIVLNPRYSHKAFVEAFDAALRSGMASKLVDAHLSRPE